MKPHVYGRTYPRVSLSHPSAAHTSRRSSKYSCAPAPPSIPAPLRSPPPASSGCAVPKSLCASLRSDSTSVVPALMSGSRCMWPFSTSVKSIRGRAGSRRCGLPGCTSASSICTAMRCQSASPAGHSRVTLCAQLISANCEKSGSGAMLVRVWPPQPAHCLCARLHAALHMCCRDAPTRHCHVCMHERLTHMQVLHQTRRRDEDIPDQTTAMAESGCMSDCNAQLQGHAQVTRQEA